MPESRLHALIVSNDGRIADDFLLSLHQIGFEATAAYRAETAVALARSIMPDILIIGAWVGEISGMKLAAEIAGELPDCEVVLFSTNTPADIVVDSQTANLRLKLLIKPAHPQDALDHLASLAHWPRISDRRAC